MRSVFVLTVFIVQMICTSSATDDSVISKSAGNLEHELSSNVVNDNVNRKIFIMRHGERVDRVFKTWITDSFNGETYLRKDLNMPKMLPQKTNQPQSWEMDSPLTYIGHYQAKLVGDAMKEHNIILDHVYSSPSYRSIQTCSAVLKGLGVKEKTPINIEPGLIEYLGWYVDGVQFCTLDELESVKININRNYEPFITLEEDLNTRINETVSEFYDRNAAFVEYLLKRHNDVLSRYNIKEMRRLFKFITMLKLGILLKLNGILFCVVLGFYCIVYFEDRPDEIPPMGYETFQNICKNLRKFVSVVTRRAKQYIPWRHNTETTSDEETSSEGGDVDTSLATNND